MSDPAREPAAESGGSLPQLKNLIGEICAVDPRSICSDEWLRGYGVDSLRALDLMTSIEEEFRVELSIEDLARIQTVGELARYLDRLLAA
jgi:acyl carrier protein